MTARINRDWLIWGLLLVIIVGFLYVLKAREDSQVALMEARLEEKDAQIAEIETRAAAREKTLKRERDALAKKFEAAKTPKQIVKLVTEYIPFPEPIELTAATPRPVNIPDAPAATLFEPDSLVLTPPNLEALKDYVGECEDCKLERTALKETAVDRLQQIDLLRQEVKIARQTAKGGTVFRRVWRAGKWFVIGGAVGYVVAKTR